MKKQNKNILASDVPICDLIINKLKYLKNYLKSTKFREDIADNLLSFYLSFGVICIVVILGVILVEGSDKSLISALGIFLGSQIAGIAVYKNILNAEQVKTKEDKENKLKNSKILLAYFNHSDIILGQIESSVKYSIDHINRNKDNKIEEIKVNAFLNLNTEIEALRASVEKMLDPNLHKDTSPYLIQFIIDIKTFIVIREKTLYFLDELYIPMNKKDEVVQELNTIEQESIKFKKLLEKYKAEIQN